MLTRPASICTSSVLHDVQICPTDIESSTCRPHQSTKTKLHLLSAAFVLAGFEAHDVTMSDLAAGRSRLAPFSGVAFVGGFSFADVLGAAKGWASGVLFNERTRTEFKAFRRRTDTFSLGVCNGCQLMSLLGWVGESGEWIMPK